MPLSKEECYEALELPVGTDQDSIRTSYKRLATKWHPEKNNNNPQALKKFQLISTAYRKLTTNDERLQNLNKDQSLTLFKEVLFTKSMNSFNGSTYDSTDDDDDDDDDDNDNDDFDDERYASLFPDRFKLKQDLKKAKAGINNSNKHLSVEQINKNAEDLITEEEKEKRRAEKRRAKKKRRREKKKLEKHEEEKPIENTQKIKVKDPVDIIEKNNKPKKVEKKESESSSDGTDFDPNSAFFTKVKNKKKNKQSSIDGHRDRRGQGGNSDDEPDDLDPVVLRSRQLAIKGNEMAQQGHYTAAIELFSEAIKLDPRDFRFFGNRSYCFDRTNQYDRALKDAEKAISLADKWPKGYFRKGRALAGLRMFSEAEDAFSQVLKLDKNCEDAVQELLRVRTSQIREMGFSKSQAEAAIKQYGTVQSALDNLLAGVAENVLGGEVYVSDDETGFSSPVTQRVHQPKQKDQKMDFKNPEGLTALWVGNVLPDKVDDKKLFKIFSRYGNVTSVRCLPEKYCAFINYSSKEAAGKAMHHLQGYECGGQKLLIKFPDNPILNGTGNVTIRKTAAPGTLILQKSKQPNKVPVQTPTQQELAKQSGPVNGDECYFWRTTGCSFGDKCRNKHNPTSKGIDMKPWQLKK